MFDDLETRARYFGVVSGAAGLGAAAGPLIGGVVTTYVSWRASFLLRVLVVAVIIVLARRRIEEPSRPEHRPAFDLGGAALSAAGLFFVVVGILQSATYGWVVSRTDFAVGGVVLIPAGGISPVWVFVGIGALILAGFVLHLRARERAHRDPLVSLRLFRNRASNLGLVTQNLQWLVLQGSFFVISVYLQQVGGYSAIGTGLVLLPATIGMLLASAAAERMARRHAQRRLIRAGFSLTVAGLVALLALARIEEGVLAFVPGLLLVGLGTGVMLTASVNLVQSAWPDEDQGDVSGISRSVSNLGSLLGTALLVPRTAVRPAGS